MLHSQGSINKILFLHDTFQISTNFSDEDQALITILERVLRVV